MVERETVDLTVDYLSTDGLWRDGERVTVLEDPSNKERKVTAIMMVKDCAHTAPKDCHNCSSALSSEDLIIHTECGWVIPCNNCKMFVWFKEEEEKSHE